MHYLKEYVIYFTVLLLTVFIVSKITQDRTRQPQV
ncbi:Uncharacterised protein [Salmonella enterica subsp. indica]|uniref:Uncharacterized protein n=1 Tax=Salmonella enterica subsp. indica TaxID=59207 RepID=A0A379XV03_SALER|nr:Uncharacterised protein [Salmonella enterica subsp. indica]